MGEMQVEELRGPFDTIIRHCFQKAQELEEKGKDEEAQQYYMHVNRIKEMKSQLLGE